MTTLGITIASITVGTLAILTLIDLIYSNKNWKSIGQEYDNISLLASQGLQKQALNSLPYDILDTIGYILVALKFFNSSVVWRLEKMKKETGAAMHLIYPVSGHEKNLPAYNYDTLPKIEQLNSEIHTTKQKLIEDFPDGGFLTNLGNELTRLTNFSPSLIRRGAEYPLGAEKEILLLWICHEALNNIVKHSRARNLNIDITYLPSSFFLTISDDGIGFDYYFDLFTLKQKGKGIQNMSTAARMIKANLDIQSQRGQGTMIFISLPIFPTNSYAKFDSIAH